MVLKDEDDTLNKIGLSHKTTDDFNIESNIWGRYNKVGIVVTDNYFTNSGSIFR